MDARVSLSPVLDVQDSRHGKHLLVGLLERINSLLEVDVVRRKLGLHIIK